MTDHVAAAENVPRQTPVTSTVGASCCIEAHPELKVIKTASEKMTVRVLIWSPFLFPLGLPEAPSSPLGSAPGCASQAPVLLEEARYLAVNAQRKRKATC